jgi:hypothetical protein
VRRPNAPGKLADSEQGERVATIANRCPLESVTTRMYRE